jgi:hypothetical protein
MRAVRFAVIGRSEAYPMLYHMNQTRPDAERLRQRREAAIKRPCFVVPMGEWEANPLTALQEAEAARPLPEEPARPTGHDRYPATGQWR